MPFAALSALPYEIEMLADWLTQGKPELGWRGDPRLELRIGILAASKNGVDPRLKRFVTRGQEVARCLEVWRHCEDGEDRRIVMRGFDRYHEIIPAIIELDPRTPGYEDSFTRANRENEVADRAAATRVREAHGEAVEHLWSIVSERENGRQTIRQVPGRNPDKQA